MGFARAGSNPVVVVVSNRRTVAVLPLFFILFRSPPHNNPADRPACTLTIRTLRLWARTQRNGGRFDVMPSYASSQDSERTLRKAHWVVEWMERGSSSVCSLSRRKSLSSY